MNRRTVGKIIFGIVIALVVVFAAITVYGNWFSGKPGEIKTPDVKDATYALTVKNTGTVIMATKVEVVGEAVGSRTYILNGYWELQGSKFVQKSGQLVMAEKVWGEITMKRRVTS